ncbi:hypothetical protein AALP_AA3G282700 [Arabis alpina]|uniref:Uncharacterized protein n=1 Tax=Arabis alpina TaxID=50452 RepID=A0A087HC97_ARAAL|nr:hypothetical protein AALP_AA3G282700 [Arabis alpina]
MEYGLAAVPIEGKVSYVHGVLERFGGRTRKQLLKGKHNIQKLKTSII